MTMSALSILLPAQMSKNECSPPPYYYRPPTQHGKNMPTRSNKTCMHQFSGRAIAASIDPYCRHINYCVL
jgi:hypothetical protein